MGGRNASGGAHREDGRGAGERRGSRPRTAGARAEGLAEAAQGLWIPRSADELAKIVLHGEFVTGTPERTAVVLLKAWQARKFGIISHNCADALKTDANMMAGKIRRTIGRGPDVVKILSIEEGSAERGA